MKTIEIPPSIHTISKYAFKGKKTKNVDRIVLHDGITNIESYAFWECTAFCEIIDNGIELHHNSFRRFRGLYSIVFDDRRTIIPACCCCDCSSLVYVKYPEALEKIEVKAFEGCSLLTSLYLPIGVEVIEESAFGDCTSIKQVSLPATIKYIGRDAFNNIPIESLFCYIKNPEEVNINDDVDGMFINDVFDNCHLFVPQDSLELYKNHNIFGYFNHIIPMINNGYD
jgi:hypothetical protein